MKCEATNTHYHSTTGSAEGNKKLKKPVISEMERWRKMLSAIQNSSTMPVMLVAHRRIHYSTVQEDILNICVNMGYVSTWSFVRYFKADMDSTRKQNNIKVAHVSRP